MSEAPFINFYTSDFLAGTSGMTAATKGVYITLLCLIYEAEAPLAQNWDTLARRCGCTRPAFRKAVEALEDDGKIEVNDGLIWSEKCEKHLALRAERRNSAKAAAKKRWQKSEKKQARADATAFNPQCKPEPEPEIEANASISRARKRASRLPENWQLPKEWGDWALSEGWSEATTRAEAEKFRDYWIAAPGAKGRKLDWFATWRNWLRNVPKQEKADGGRNADGSAAAMAQRIAERRAARRMDSGESGNAPIPLFSAGRSG